jgi:hypothetical protein
MCPAFPYSPLQKGEGSGVRLLEKNRDAREKMKIEKMKI